MSIKDRTVLKELFENGDIPDENAYADMIDSAANLSGNNTSVGDWDIVGDVTISGTISATTISATYIDITEYEISGFNVNGGDITVDGGDVILTSVGSLVSGIPSWDSSAEQTITNTTDIATVSADVITNTASINSLPSLFVAVSGDTMTGALNCLSGVAFDTSITFGEEVVTTAVSPATATATFIKCTVNGVAGYGMPLFLLPDPPADPSGMLLFEVLATDTNDLTFTPLQPAGNLEWFESDLVTSIISTTFDMGIANTGKHYLSANDWDIATTVSWQLANISADVGTFDLFTNLRILNLYDSSAVYGNIGTATFSPMLCALVAQNTNISGDIASVTFPAGLTDRIFLSNTNISGDLAASTLPTGLADLRIDGTGVTYQSTGGPFTSISNGVNITIHFTTSMIQAHIDNMLADLDSSGATGGTVNMAGGNPAPSAAGLVSKSNLQGKGWTVFTG